MAEDDDLISAMWRSLVPAFAYGEGAGDVDMPAMDHRIYQVDEGVLGVKAYYAEAEENELVRAYPEVEPLDYWNPQETMMEEDYAKAVRSVEFLTEDEASAEMQQALSDSLKPAKDIYCLGDLECSGFWNQLTGSLDDSPAVEMIKTQPTHLSSGTQAQKKIYRMPTAISKASEDYYYPQYISIGPYHNKNEITQAAEWDKYKFYENLHNSRRVSWSKCKLELQEAKVVKVLKDYYPSLVVSDSKDDDGKTMGGDELDKPPEKEGTVKMNSKELARCMFLDACFILAHFRILPWSNDTDSVVTARDDRPSSVFTWDDSWNISADLVMHDICLMENQIPFFIIQIIYHLHSGKDIIQESYLRHQIVEFLRKTLLKPYPIADFIAAEATEQFQHILHYCHMCFIPSSFPNDKNEHVVAVGKPQNTKEFKRWRRAMDLYEKGIQFTSVSKDEGARSLLDIKFQSGEWKIPTLIIDRYTTFLFGNILAFEQSTMPLNSSDQRSNYFSAYVKFMADLMATPEDIALLSSKRVIENNLGKDDEVLDLFNTLRKGIGFLYMEDTYLRDTFTKLEEHYGTRSTQYLTDLRRNYLKNPWLIIGVAAAIAVFIFSGMAAWFNLRDHLRSSCKNNSCHNKMLSCVISNRC